MTRLERVPAWAVLTGMVAVSTGLRSLAAWGVDSPWIAPDEMIYALLGRSLWGSGELSILGADTGFYSLLYPALVGLPLSLADAETGHRALQVTQALVVSCTAIPVYLWGRRLARERYALAAAALTLALPALGYSALVMSEALFVPIATFALWALARALERPTAGRQALLALAVAAAVATRLQAVVFVPVVVTAVLVKATLDRDPSVLRRFGLALGAIATGTVALAFAGSGALGAYAAAGEGSYDFGAAARFVGYHAAGVIVISGIVPALALLVLWITTAGSRETSQPLRAFLAVTLAYIPWLVLEVGIFASREIGHLAGRDLATAAPLTLLGLAVWLDRGAPRPQPLTSLVALLAAAGPLLLPIRQFAEPGVIHDTLELIPLAQLAARVRELVFALAVAGALVLFVFLPRRAVTLLLPAVFIALAATSVVASREAAEQSSLREISFLGGRPTWVDDTGVEGAAYLYVREFYWPVVWQHLFWNRAIEEIWTLGDSQVPGPLPQVRVSPRSNGRLASASGPVDAAAVIAPTSVTLVGERVAEIRQQGLLAAGLVLWRPDPPIRTATVTGGVLANGDIVEPATLTVYDCGPGRLEVTLLGKAGNPVSLRLDGITRRVVEVPSNTVWRGVLETEPYALEDGVCVFGLASDGLLGSTRLEYVRR